MYDIILASGSPRRKELLEQIGLAFQVIPAQGEEKGTKENPAELVQELSYQKALEIAEGKLKDDHTVIIGADTVVSYWGNVMGKPVDEADAKRMLLLLQNQTHQVYTGVTLFWLENGIRHHVSFNECTDVTVYPMEEKQIQDYIESGEPMDKAGAYGIQGRFAAYIQAICGDYTNVVGLPVGRLYQELYKRKFVDKERS
ncbi:MAG: Maf family protein [Lachnospiraceae bacterium]|nr:Maf family protein [Lachnospiraceae bacterium]